MNELATKTQADKKTILIVDDIPLNVGVVVEHLEFRGFEVAIALGGEEAIERARFLKPDLILLDVMMPGIDGFETCRRLKALPDTRDIPVIFMTALGDVNDKTEGFDAGGLDYVRKPFQVGDLLARVNTHLELAAERQRLRRELRAMQAELDRCAEAAGAPAAPGARFRQLFDTADDAILLVDCRSEAVADANPAAARMLGRLPEELIGRRLTDLPALGAARGFVVREVMKARHVKFEDWRIERPEGPLAVEVIGTLHRDREGELIELSLRDAGRPAARTL